MADISKITTLDGTTYNLKDAAVPAWAKTDIKPTYTAQEVGAIPTTQKGVAGGVAELDSNGKVPSSQLPPGNDNVTGVKGDAESLYRTGQINLTAANIGAVSKSGDTMTGLLNIRNTLFSQCIELIPPVGAGNGGYVDFAYNAEEIDFTSRIIEKQRGVLDVNGVTFQNGNLTGKTNGYSWDTGTENTIDSWVPVFDANMGLQHRVLPAWLNNMDIVPVDHGGTGSTTPAGARANLDVPSTTGSGASGTWNINIPFDYAGATGFKNFGLNGTNIDNTRGNWEAGFSERTNHGTFPAWGGWCNVAQYDCDHFLYQVANYVDSNGSKVYSLSVRSRWWGGPWGPWTDIFYGNGAVPVASGGTGATTPDGACANIGAVKKSGDIMTGNLGFAYANMLSYGEQTTRRWLLYPNGDLSVFHLATQELVNGEWANWRGVITAHTDGSIEINQPLGTDQGGTGARTPAQARTNLEITPANIGAVAKSGDTMTGSLYVPNMVVRSGSWQFYFMQDSNGAEVGHVRGDEAAHHIAFREMTPGTNSAYEDYYLPNPTNQSGGAGYSILTTKSAVGVSQGGTGATTPAGARQNFFPDDLSNESVAYMAGFTTGWAKGGWLQLPLPFSYGGTGATTAAGARANLGIATTVTTVTTTGITSHGNWKSNLNPNNVVIDAAYCTAGGIAVTPYCNTSGTWSFHCIDVSTNAAYGTAFDLTIRYHNIY